MSDARVYEEHNIVKVIKCTECPNFHGGAPWYEAVWCSATEMHRNPFKYMKEEDFESGKIGMPEWCPLPKAPKGIKTGHSINFKIVPITKHKLPVLK